MSKILITGASGFIGSFIVEEALRRGMDVWAAVRPTSSRRYLTDKRINFIELDFSSTEKLKSRLEDHTFDYVVHAAGVTKCLHRDDFRRVNTEGTKHLVDALLELSMPIKRFVFLSSLSVFGAVCERQPYRDITDDDIPRPNTAYGRSKLEAERYLESIGNDFPYIILRPTGVYGPRERDYYLMAQSIKRHVDISAGFRRQDLTFVYVKDLVEAIYRAVEREVTGRAYFVSDGQVYRSRTFSDLIRRELGNPWLVRFTCPLWLLKAISYVAGNGAKLARKTSTLNPDKYRIMKQRNWRCDITPLERDLGYQPRYLLEEGVKETIEWYKEEGWL